MEGLAEKWKDCGRIKRRKSARVEGLEVSSPYLPYTCVCAHAQACARNIFIYPSNPSNLSIKENKYMKKYYKVAVDDFSILPQPFHVVKHPSIAQFWTFDDVEARLIEAMRVFRYGLGKPSLFATDGPWAVMRLDWSDRYAPHEDMAERAVVEATRTPRPDRAMIARAEEAGQWLGQIARVDDRKIVVGALDQLVRGVARLDWGLVTDSDPAMRGRRDWARVRYSRAITALTVLLNGKITGGW
jgi:hypothetical protein